MSTLDRGEWSASRFGLFITEENGPHSHPVGKG
jgi:hypothetical protein